MPTHEAISLLLLPNNGRSNTIFPEWTMSPYRIINTRKHGGYHKRTLCRQFEHSEQKILHNHIWYLPVLCGYIDFLQRVLFSNKYIPNL